MNPMPSLRDCLSGLLCLAAFLTIAAGLASLAPHDARATTAMGLSALSAPAATMADMAALRLAMEQQ